MFKQPRASVGALIGTILGAVLIAASLAAAAPASATTYGSVNLQHWVYFGWQGDHPKSTAMVGGDLSPGNGPIIQYSLTTGSTTYGPDETENSSLKSRISWTLANGYLPSPISQWTAGTLKVTIQHFANQILSGAATAVFTRVTVMNPTASTVSTSMNIKGLPAVEVPLSGTPTSTDTNSMHYTLSVGAGSSVTRDFVAKAAGTATATQLAAAGSFDTNYSSMSSYWNGRLAATASPASLPDPQLVNMFKADQIVEWEGVVNTSDGSGGTNYEVRGSGGTPPGAPTDNYDGTYSHDVPDIVSEMIREGNFSLAKQVLSSSYYLAIAQGPESDYLDGIPKFIEPYWQYLMYTGDETFFTPAIKTAIENAAHYVSTLRVTSGTYNGLMQASNTFDNGSNYLVIDNMAAINGLQTYSNLANAWSASDSSWTAEKTWAISQANSINSALNARLGTIMSASGAGYYNACLDGCDWLSSGDYMGNWLGTTLMMSSLPWDGVLAGYTGGGTWQQDLDSSALGAFTTRAVTASSFIPPHSWGAWSDDSNGYGTVYNGGAGVQLLASAQPQLRTEAISDLEWLLSNQSSPMQWGESFAADGSSWTTNLADLESWGLSGNDKALLQTSISNAADGSVIIGRGIPNSWITSGVPITWNNVPVSGNHNVNVNISASGNAISLSLTGGPTTGPIKFELPAFVGNIVSTTTGTIDNTNGIVTMPAGTASVTVTVQNLNQTNITVASSTTAHYSFGQSGDQVQRYQTFIANSMPTLNNVTVDIQKINGTAQTNVTVGLYATSAGSPTGSALATTTIPASSVGTSDTVLTAPLSYNNLVDGQQYAVVLGQTTPSTSNDYEWATTGSGGVLRFGKNTGSAWVNESSLGDAWLKVNVSASSNPPTDIVVANSTAAHYTFGQTGDQLLRFQTFNAGTSPNLQSVNLDIRKINGTSQSNVTVALYATSGGLPTGSALATSTIPAASIGTSDTVVSANLPYAGLVNGTRYAIVLGQVTPGTSNEYEWATTGTAAVYSFGKNTGSTWVDESSLGDAWLTVVVTH
jgi:hypothetical protein